MQVADPGMDRGLYINGQAPHPVQVAMGEVFFTG